MPPNLPRRPGSWLVTARSLGPIPRWVGAAMFALAVVATFSMWSIGSRAGFYLLVLTAIAWAAFGDHRPRPVLVHAPAGTGGLSYLALSPRQFEEAVAALCRRDGCTRVQVSGGAGDLGADVLATAPDGRRIVIQCKRYGPASKVGSPHLQRFGGTCYSVHHGQVAAVVTTATFTQPALDYARTHHIRCIDGHALAAWSTRTGRAPWM